MNNKTSICEFVRSFENVLVLLFLSRGRVRRQLLQEGRAFSCLFGRIARIAGSRQLLAWRRRAQRIPEATFLHAHCSRTLQHSIQQEARNPRICLQAKHCRHEVLILLNCSHANTFVLLLIRVLHSHTVLYEYSICSLYR